MIGKYAQNQDKKATNNRKHCLHKQKTLISPKFNLHKVQIHYMKHLFTSLFILAFSAVYSQSDSLLITTKLTVDSLFCGSRKLEYIQANDSLLRSSVERNEELSHNNLVIYSREKRYEIDLPADPIATFPAEWSERKAEYPVTLYITVNKGEWVTMTASGSAVNLLSPLTVYDKHGNVISNESTGVQIVRNRHGKRKNR